jgi:hypothetical protein
LSRVEYISPRGAVLLRTFAVSYEEWEEHYSSFDVPSLVAEVMTFDAYVPVLRTCALLVRLIRLATNDPHMSYEERLKAASLAVATGRTVKSIPGVEAALRQTLENQQTFGLYPAIASTIVEGVFDQQSVVGQILSRLEAHEVDLLESLVARGGAAVVYGNQDHRKFDRLESMGYIKRRAVALDAVEYELTSGGREALQP